MLKFYSTAGLLVSEPFAVRIKGQPARYVNRRYHPPSRSYIAKTKPSEYKEDTDEARRLIKLVRRDQCLLPADEYTAKACGVEYYEPELIDGEWHI